MIKLHSFRVVAVLTLALLLGQANAGIAQVTKPFKINGAGIGPTGLPLPGQEPRMHWAIGEATHLGRYYGEGSVRTDSATFNPNGTITGEFGSGAPFVFQAANGDKLVCYYGRTDFGASQPGTFELTIVDVLPGNILVVQAVWIAEFVVQPNDSTGRFSGATGSWVMYAFSQPFVLGSSDPVYYGWKGNGNIVFDR